MNKIKAESLQHARQQIDAIDTALVELIAARQFYVDQTTRFKKTETDLQSPDRMEQVIENVRAHAQLNSVDADAVEHLYREMFKYFIQRELKEFRP
ncbi:chorismate mutase [Acinetobacter wanghuae]|uniref:chorismate mutase n=1 Tax=Acinetobacter wanghuae TaxID=2662362 RepID=A0A5Q0P7V0_9GAMM|nr:chorismate mutase [Acinetobacter wanghuae]MQW92675.1 chorismate mutase [Acinetobacter wanghuae]QGA12231.1 chorismate mutase [Acinetobacter wanghuae]